MITEELPSQNISKSAANQQNKQQTNQVPRIFPENLNQKEKYPENFKKFQAFFEFEEQ